MISLALLTLRLSLLTSCGVHANRDTADVGVPDLGIEAHRRGLEGIHVRNDNVDLELATSIRSVGRADKGALEVCQVRRVDRAGIDAGVVLVIVDVCQLLGDAALASGGHPAATCGEEAGKEDKLGEAWMLIEF